MMEELSNEQQLTTAVLVLLSVVLLLIITTLIKKWTKAADAAALLPPGPRKLPLIGNIHLVGELTFRSFRDLAKRYGPIMHVKLCDISIVAVSSPEAAEEFLKTHGPNFANRPTSMAMEIIWYDYNNIVFSPYGSYWRQMRKICVMEFLSPRIVRSFASIRNDEISRLVESIRLNSGKPVNLSEKIFWLTSSITCRAAFGKKSPKLIGMVKEALQLVGEVAIADLFPSSRVLNALSWKRMRLVKMRRKLDAILDDIIDEHRDNLAKIGGGGQGDLERTRGNGEFGNEDLVDVLLRMKEGGELEFPIGNDNIKAVMYDMFLAGSDSTSTTIEWAMAELIRNPRVMSKAQAEVRQAFSKGELEENDVSGKLKYLKMVIKESLRLHPPVPFIPRASIEEQKVRGYTIPAKTTILVNIWAIQRDPNYWSNPESFEPERFENDAHFDLVGRNFQLLPFGSGKRMCPGMTFGLANVEQHLAHLLYNFDWKLQGSAWAEDLDMTETPGMTASRKEDLVVVATPYEA